MVARKRLVVAALFLAVLLKDFETTVIVTALPTVAADLGGIRLYPWVFIAYLFAAIVGQPLLGKLADMRGRKPVFLAATGLFTVGAIGCGFAPSIEALIACRVVQGLGGGAMHVVAGALIGDLFDARSQAKIEGMFTASLAIGGGLGPIIGGLIVDVVTWRWVFWGVVPLSLACAALIGVGLRERVEPQRRPLDLAGTAMLSSAIATLLAAAHAPHRAVELVVLAVVLVAVFIRVQRRATDPLVPLDIFRNPVIAVSSACLFLIGAALLSTMAFLPLYVQGVLGRSPAIAGWVMMPLSFGWMLASLVAAWLLPRLGYRPLIRGGLVVGCLGAALLLSSVIRGGQLGSIQAAVLCMGFGLGLGDVATWIAMQTTVDDGVRGITTAINTVVFSVGGVLGVGGLGAFLGGRFVGVELTDAAAVADSLRLAYPTMVGIVLAMLILASLIGLRFPVLHMQRPEPRHPRTPHPGDDR